MGITYLLGILLAALSVRSKAPGISAFGIGRFPPLVRSLVPAAVVIALCGTFAEHVHLLDVAATRGPMPGWRGGLPFAIFSTAASRAQTDAGLATAVQCCTLAESALLALLYAALRCAAATAGGRRAAAAAVAGGALGMAFLALHARLAGPDIYAMVGFGLMPDPYRPAGATMPPADAVIDLVRGSTLVPSPYGPLWNALAHVLARSSADLGRQVTAFRACGALALAVSAAALLRLRRPALAALLVLNPLLWEFNVAEGHNDIAGIALVLVALAFRRRLPALAVALVALAGAVKFPFIVAGAAVFFDEPSRPKRLAAAASAAVGGLVLSALFGGAEYAAALRRTAELYAQPNAPATDVTHGLLAAVAVAAVGYGLATGRSLFGAGWSFAAFGQVAAPWYLGWGIPYAVRDEAAGALYLVALPVAGYVATLLFEETPLSLVVRFGLVTVLLVSLVARLRARSQPAESANAAPAAAGPALSNRR